MPEAECRHFFVVDADGNRIGKFDIQSKRQISLPDGCEFEPIRIPKHAEGREKAIQRLTENTVKWDSRLLNSQS